MRLRKALQNIHSKAIHHGKKAIHHVRHLHHHVARFVDNSHRLMHQHRHHFLATAHILLLLGLFMFYHITGVMFANEETVVPPTEVAADISIDAPVEAPSETPEEVTADTVSED